MLRPQRPNGLEIFRQISKNEVRKIATVVSISDGKIGTILDYIGGDRVLL